MSLLAVDMGSSSCKAVAFSNDGNALARARHSYSAESRHPYWSEMQPELFWKAFTTTVQTIATQLADDPVEALGISSHGETFFPVDSTDRTISPAILNADNRAVEEAKWLAEDFGRENIFEITGLTAHAMYPLPKILWLRKHQQDVFSRSARFLSLPGYILLRLGLSPYVDYSLASRFLAFDICKREWAAGILEHCDLTPDRFPDPVPAGTVVGELSTKAASEIGLKPLTPVVLGGHDQPCAALGSGVIGPGRISASLGTYECLTAASDKPALNASALAANLNSYCHVIPGRYVTLAYFPSGIMIDWFLRLIHSSDHVNGTSDLLASLEASAPSGPTGMCVTPHLLGTCNPDFDPNASGVIAGIRPTTTQGDIYKGVLEGIAFEFANMVQLLEQAAGAFRDVFVSGGGGRSRLALQLRAAIAERNLHLMQCQEAVCLGTAILAGVSIGKYPSFEDAVEQVVRVSRTIAADESLTASYQKQKCQYHLLYSSLSPFRASQAHGD
jgi:xylulokinase